MFIIIEGMDNTGKSTLAFQLASDLQAVLVNNRHKPKTYHDVECWTISMLGLKRHTVVFDRWAAISEPVYGPICRDTHILTEEQIQDLYQHLKLNADRQVKVIYCRPPDKAVLGTMEDREQMAGVVDNSKALLAEYDRRMMEVTRYIQVITYDWTGEDAYEHLLAKL